MTTTLTFKVEKMRCGGCVSNVQQKLDALEGVDSASVDLAAKTAVVSGTVDAQTVIDTLTQAGYPTELEA